MKIVDGYSSSRAQENLPEQSTSDFNPFWSVGMPRSMFIVTRKPCNDMRVSVAYLRIEFTVAGIFAQSWTLGSDHR